MGEVERTVRTPPCEASTPQGVGVAVRVRPLSTVERANPSVRNCVHCLQTSILIKDSASGASSLTKRFGNHSGYLRPQQFEVDLVLHPHCSQIEVYEQSCRHIVEGVFQGINGSILAYGATGSGKTHTMFGGPMSAAGVVYQAVQDIFAEKVRLEEEEGRTVRVRCSFVEIYNEEVFDLLVPVAGSPVKRGASSTSLTNGLAHLAGPLPGHGKHLNGRQALHVLDGRRDRGGAPRSRTASAEGLTIHGVTHIHPTTADEFARSVELGHTNRFVASTGANAQSSRSHAIITVEVEVESGVARGGRQRGTVARIRFCDLAGSERAASTSNSGLRLREGGNINRSLLALGAVVQALVEKKRNPSKEVFVPYRGSKLTRLLQDSLGGNCRTHMLFCVSPSTQQYEETLNTMHFAMQAKEVQVVARRNGYSVNNAVVARSQEALIEELRGELAAVREEMARLGVPLSRASLPGSSHYPSQTGGGLGRSASWQSAFFSERLEGTRAPSEPSPSGLFSSSTHGESALREPGGALGLGLDGGGDGLGGTGSVHSPGPPAGARLLRSSVFMEGTPLFTELESTFKRYTAEKEGLYHMLKDAQETQSDRDIQLRQHKWKLARFLASNAMSGRARHASTEAVAPTTPVGVAGLQSMIATMEAEGAAHGGELAELMDKLNDIDCHIASTRRELLREKQHTSLELLLDNAKLRQNCTEAECFAAHYHQECRVLNNRREEFTEALALCVSALQQTLPHLPYQSTALEQVKLALFYACLPTARTEDMIAAFEDSLRVNSTPPLAPGGARAGAAAAAAAAAAAVATAAAPPPPAQKTLEETYEALVEAARHLRTEPHGRRGHRPAGPSPGDDNARPPRGLGDDAEATPHGPPHPRPTMLLQAQGRRARVREAERKTKGRPAAATSSARKDIAPTQSPRRVLRRCVTASTPISEKTLLPRPHTRTESVRTSHTSLVRSNTASELRVKTVSDAMNRLGVEDRWLSSPSHGGVSPNGVSGASPGAPSKWHTPRASWEISTDVLRSSERSSAEIAPKNPVFCMPGRVVKSYNGRRPASKRSVGALISAMKAPTHGTGTIPGVTPALTSSKATRVGGKDREMHGAAQGGGGGVQLIHGIQVESCSLGKALPPSACSLDDELLVSRSTCSDGVSLSASVAHGVMGPSLMCSPTCSDNSSEEAH